MKDSYNMDYKENEVRKALNGLQKVNAPDGFEERLFARIENGDFTEEKSSNMWVAMASSAAGLAIAFYAFGLFSTAPQTDLNLNSTQIVESKKVEAKQDSVKQVPKTFNQNLNLVKDKK